MSLIVEDGTGITLANSYVTIAEADAYNAARNETTWMGSSSEPVEDAAKEVALICAGDYMNRRWGPRLLGIREFLNIQHEQATFNFTSFPENGDTLTIGSVTYTFVTTATSVLTDITIANTFAETLSGLVSAINGVTGQGVGTGTGHPQAAVKVGPAQGLAVYSRAVGLDAAGIAVSQVGDFGTWNFDELSGGSFDGLPQGMDFPRVHVLDASSRMIRGVPRDIKHAQIEYATRALVEVLAPDLPHDANGRIATRVREKVGPIEEEVRYSDTSTVENALRSYPMPDRFFKPYIGTGGRVSR